MYVLMCESVCELMFVALRHNTFLLLLLGSAIHEQTMYIGFVCCWAALLWKSGGISMRARLAIQRWAAFASKLAL